MTRPLIGLTGRRKTGRDMKVWPDALGHLEIDLYVAHYAQAILAAGGLPVHLPSDIDPAEVIGSLDGLLLSGGADLDPALWGAAPETDDFPPEPARDAFELRLVEEASNTETPVLGICRGLQLINVGAGGSLHQHVEFHGAFHLDPSTELHEVSFEQDSVLGQIYGERRSVNSLHHQTVDRVGEHLRVTAMADDGTIEGLEHTDLPIVTVQWHPEMMSSAATDPIFGWFIDRAAAHA